MKEVIVNFPVRIKKFAAHTEVKQIVLDKINAQNNFEHIVSAGTDISRCDWKNHSTDWTRGWLAVLAQPLKAHIHKWATELGYESFDIHEIWFQQYTHGGSHGWHTHSSNFTNVYYLDLPAGSPKTEWIDPITKNTYSFDVEEGDIITFPSFLLHRAPINKSNETKTIISWNLSTSVNDFYGGQKNGNI